MKAGGFSTPCDLCVLSSDTSLILTASFEKHQQEIEHRHLIGLGKPLDLDELLQTIETLLQRA